MIESWYDDLESISIRLNTLEDLHLLKTLRHEAWYTRKEPLTEFYLFGVFHTDSCGNFGTVVIEKDYSKICDFTKEMNIPKVVTRKGFSKLIQYHFRDIKSLSWSSGFGQNPLPPSGSVCVVCGVPWAIDNCFKAKPTIDHGYCHPECIIKLRTNEVKNEIIKSLDYSGYPPRQITEIPNEYGSESYNGNWFLIYFPSGELSGRILKIGWRKRVINLVYSMGSLDLTHLFKDENTTNYPGFVHAWSYEKLTEYLIKLKKYL